MPNASQLHAQLIAIEELVKKAQVCNARLKDLLRDCHLLGKTAASPTESPHCAMTPQTKENP